MEESGAPSVEPPDEVVVPASERPNEEAIFTCKFPGCTRQYASTDGVRKHCRKSHPDWLRQVDEDKVNHSCRWAAYCTREAITEANDPRMTPVGSKRAREIMAAGGALPPRESGIVDELKAGVRQSFGSEGSGSFRRDSVDDAPAPKPEPKVPKHAPHNLAMDGKSCLVPLRPVPPSASAENIMPPEMIALPGELNTPLPINVSALTPNAQARQRLGEIADSESICLQGGTWCTFPSSPVVDEVLPSNNVLRGNNSFFVQWGMPPIKRGMSLNDTREASAQQAARAAEWEGSPGLDDASVTHDSPSFLDSVLVL